MPYAVHQSHIEMLRHARRFTKRADEAEDLLQEVLLSAIEAGRSDLSDPDNRRWMVGALRKRALFEARTAARRKNRDSSYSDSFDQVIDPSIKPKESMPLEFLSTLPKSLRTTTLLILTGHSKQEIIYLLQITDQAFRQRLTSIRKRWKASNNTPIEDLSMLDSSLPLGLIRKALLMPAKSEDVHLASHDPDGNLFLVCSQNNSEKRSQKMGARQLVDTIKPIEE